MINLLRNAYDAVAPGGKILIETIANAPEEGYFTVRVKDDGAGIAPENLKKIFNPFFTTKKEKGSGLGLSVSYGLARKMGGRIDAFSPEQGGAEFLIILPVTQLRQTPAEIPKTPLITRKGQRIIIG
jgi:two-component system NtrC family sensor kinase